MNYFESKIFQPRCTTLISAHSLVKYQKHVHGGTEDERESSWGERSTYMQFIYLFIYLWSSLLLTLWLMDDLSWRVEIPQPERLGDSCRP